jgi:hypothetical protein
VFRQQRASCATDLAVPLAPLDPAAMADIIAALDVQASVKTPLAAAIRKVADDLATVTGPRIVIVVSDGQESCGGNPTKAVKALRAGGVDVTLNIVGMGLDKQARKGIAKLAKLGGGTYFDARDPDQLELPAGTYRVVVLTKPEVTFDAVVVPPGQGLSLTLPAPSP